MAEAVLTRPATIPVPHTPALGTKAFDVPWADIVLAVAAFRMLLSLVGIAVDVLLPAAHQSSGLLAMLLDPWRHFDALRFTEIAAHGYAADGLNNAYMPLYPLLIRIVSVATFGHYLTAALIVSNLACVFAVGLFWRWVAEGFGEHVAWRAVAMLLLYPDAFYLLGAYSEGLFLALSALCLLAVRRDRPVLAGALALLATLTRLQGLVLVIPILLAAWPQRRPLRGVAPSMLGGALPLVGLLAYQRLLTTWLGGGSILNTFQQKWHIALQPPWATIQQYITVIRSPQWHLIHSPRANYVLLWDLIAAIVVLAVLLVSYRRLGAELTLFGLAAWCFALSRYLSTGRYLLAVLPFFIAVAIWAEGRRLKRVATITLPLLVFFTAEFAQGNWID